MLALTDTGLYSVRQFQPFTGIVIAGGRSLAGIDSSSAWSDNGSGDSSGEADRPPVICVNLLELLRVCVAALLQAAKETREETDGYPRNLLAAYHRTSTHVEYFLRITNPELNDIECSAAESEVLQGLRTAAGMLMRRLGDELCCPNGFVERHALRAKRPKCKARLESGALVIDELVQAFSSARDAILLLGGTSGSPTMGIPIERSEAGL